jgi:hypothetical protein
VTVGETVLPAVGKRKRIILENKEAASGPGRLKAAQI